MKPAYVMQFPYCFMVTFCAIVLAVGKARAS